MHLTYLFTSLKDVFEFNVYSDKVVDESLKPVMFLSFESFEFYVKIINFGSYSEKRSKR